MTATAQHFKKEAAKMAADVEQRGRIREALRGYENKREQTEARYQDWQRARDAAAEIKYETINHLDRYLTQLVEKLERRGTKVFWASTAKQAREYITGVCRGKNARSIVKSKSMTAEEIHLNGDLERAGYTVIETDLGEFIVQLREEDPYHIVFPAMHLTRREIRDLFAKKLGSETAEEPEELARAARQALRDKYCEAGIGITGVNFAVAETGMLAITENEGNARLTAALPPVHIALMGIEKVIPRMRDLALLLPMLATAGAGQHLTGYNTLYAGPRQRGEVDGPLEFHLVLLDNGRTSLLADAEQRDALHCIRCGACLNVCPIYKNAGGHTYGTTYPGPIGSVITPHLRGLQEWNHLSYASSLCGACTETCPVKIDLHHHLLENRRNAAQQLPKWWEKIFFGLFAWLMRNPPLFEISSQTGRIFQHLHFIVKGSVFDPMRGWTKNRELPKIHYMSFREYWRERGS